MRRSRRVLASFIAVFTLSAIILTACQNQADTNTVAKYLPDTTEGLITVALSPSTKQKVDLLMMSQHLPSNVHAKQAMQVRDNLLNSLFQDDHISFATEIKPWLGNEAAVAILPPQDGSNTPVAVAAVQAKNQQQADITLQNHHVDANTYRFLKGYVFIVDPDQYKQNNAGKALDAIQSVISGNAKSLQDNKRYTSNIKSLHGEHVLLGWFDVPTLVRQGIAGAKAEQDKITKDEQSGDDNLNLDGNDLQLHATSNVIRTTTTTTDPYADDSTDDSSSDDSSSDDSTDLSDDNAAVDALSEGPLGALGALSGLSDDTEDTNKAYAKLQSEADSVGSYSFEVYLTDSSVIFQGATEHVSSDAGATTDRAILKSLPSDTVGAVDVADFGTSMRNIFNSLTSGTNAPWASFDKSTPQVRELLNTLGNEAVAVVGNGSPLPYGLVSNVNDQQGATKAMQDVVNLVKNDATITPIAVAGGSGFELQANQSDDSSDFGDSSDNSDSTLYVAVANSRIAVSNTIDELKGLLGSAGGLGSSSQVQAAFGNVDQLTIGSVYVNLQSAINLAEKDTKQPSAQTQTWLNSLNVLGAQAWSADGHQYSEVRLGLR
jgi:hypothetical protein